VRQLLAFSCQLSVKTLTEIGISEDRSQLQIPRFARNDKNVKLCLLLKAES